MLGVYPNATAEGRILNYGGFIVLCPACAARYGFRERDGEPVTDGTVDCEGCTAYEAEKR